MTSPDLNPPSYLHGPQTNMSDPFTSPPRRKTRFSSPKAKNSPGIPIAKSYNYDDRELLFSGSEVLPPPASLILPPPAVTSYAYARSASSYTLQRSPLHSLQQQSKHLTEQLQVLLDAQSAALMSGGTFTAPQSTDSRSLDMQGTKGFGKKKAISLQEARNGVLEAMRELAEIKDVEEGVYASQAAEREGLIKAVEAWGGKTKLLEQEIQNIEEGKDGQRTEALREEKLGLETEIHQLRLHLSKLEERHSSLSIQLAELESIISSKTSSYKASLASLRNKTVNFLSTHRYASPTTAIESWSLEREALDEKKQQARTEGDALRDGIVMWEDSLLLVSGFEEKLRTQLIASAGVAGKRGNQRDFKVKIMQDIEEIIGKLEQRLKVAEERGWKLLVCCVGAELQVFLEAREVMRKSLEAVPVKSAAGPGTVEGSDDGGSQYDERSATQSRNSSLRSGLGTFGLGSGRGSTRRTLGVTESLRRGASPIGAHPPPVGGDISLLDRSDDGNGGNGDDEREKSARELLLKVDDVGDGVRDLPDYSPLDD